jgi:cytochrome c556
MPSAALLAADAKPATDQQKTRHDHYHDLGKAFKVVRDQTRSTSPDFAALQTAAKFVSDASVDQGKWFPKGSGPDAGKTRALPEIWTKPADFIAAQKVFADSAPALLAAANASDIEAVRSNFREVGKACKNCHDTFRQPADED